MLDKVTTKLTSGRFILTMAAGVVFAVISINGTLPGEAIAAIVTMVFRDYFDRRDRDKMA